MMHNAAPSGSGAGHAGADHARAVIDSRGRVRSSPPGFLAAHTVLGGHLRAAHRQRLGEQHYLYLDDRGTAWRITVESDATSTARRGTALHADRMSAPYGLTARELLILTLVTGGLTNAQIAERLSIARRTVATHVEHILAKLGQPTRSAAAAIAIGHGLLVLPLPPGTALDALPLRRLDAPDPAAPADPGGGGADRTPQETAAAAPAPAGPAGIQRRLRRRPLYLGSLYPLHGPSLEDGRAMRTGAQLAISELNSRGGVGGRRVEHVVATADLADAGGTGAALDRLLDADVDAVTLGYLAPAQQERVFSRVAEHGAPLLHTMVAVAGSELVAADPARFGRTFQVCAAEDAYISGFLRTVSDLRDQGRWRPANRRLVLVLRDTLRPDHGDLEQAAHRHGWETAEVVTVPNIGADWGRVLDRVRAQEPAAVLLTSYVESELRAFLGAFAAAPTPTLLYTVWTPSIPGFLARSGPEADGLLWSTVVGTYDDMIGSAFNRRYRRSHAADPGQASAGVHYDMVHLLAAAWQRASRPWAHDEVADALRTSVYRGVAGAYYFGGPGQRGLSFPDDTGDPSLAHAHLVYQVSGGEHRLIAPGAYATSAFTAPPWPA
ncbi:hypothetical protein GCM10027570_55820 [Streptomonospora sediminis]